MKTLIVEDDFTSRLLMQTLLSRYGECNIAVSGDEALKACYTSRMSGLPYDLVCMDILMPGMTGQEAVRELRAQEASLDVSPSEGAKIFMISSLTSMTEVMKSLNELCDAYLTKPLDVSKLLEKLRTFQLVQ